MDARRFIGWRASSHFGNLKLNIALSQPGSKEARAQRKKFPDAWNLEEGDRLPADVVYREPRLAGMEENPVFRRILFHRRLISERQSTLVFFLLLGVLTFIFSDLLGNGTIRWAPPIHALTAIIPLLLLSIRPSSKVTPLFIPQQTLEDLSHTPVTSEELTIGAWAGWMTVAQDRAAKAFLLCEFSACWLVLARGDELGEIKWVALFGLAAISPLISMYALSSHLASYLVGFAVRQARLEVLLRGISRGDPLAEILRVLARLVFGDIFLVALVTLVTIIATLTPSIFLTENGETWIKMFQAGFASTLTGLALGAALGFCGRRFKEQSLRNSTREAEAIFDHFRSRRNRARPSVAST